MKVTVPINEGSNLWRPKTLRRVSSDIDRKLRIEADKKANKLGISRAKLIEIALKSELGRFNVHKENKRLTEQAAEHQTTYDRLEREKTELTEQRDEFEKLLHAETDVCNKYDEQVKSLKKKFAKAEENLKQIASHLGVPDTVKHCKQRIDELQASIEDKRKERNRFKTKFEKAESDYRTCSEKFTLLLTRNWWDRLWNTMPWVE